MVGRWTAPYTGIIIAELSLRQVIQLMRRKGGKKFVKNKNGIAAEKVDKKS
jgi:hypothetical protein